MLLVMSEIIIAVVDCTKNHYKNEWITLTSGSEFVTCDLL